MVSRVLIIEGCVLEAVGLIWAAWKFESFDGYRSRFVGSPFEFIFAAAGDYRKEFEYFRFQIIFIGLGLILQIISLFR